MTGFKDEFANQLRPRNSDMTAKVDYRDALDYLVTSVGIGHNCFTCLNFSTMYVMNSLINM